MDPFVETLQRSISAHALLQPHAGVLVALSGGSDSVALLRALLSLGYSCVAAHCNFHLRGEESMRDERFVRDLCAGLGVELVVTHFDTLAYAHRQKMSVEMTARELRYAFFEQELQKRGLQSVCVAHHRDDNVETVLLNLIRGTGVHGLTGMRWRNGHVVRPMLQVSRSDVLAYLDRLHQPYVTDSTNLETDFTRNKIRLQLLPLMRSINPSVDVAISRTAERLSEAAQLCDAVVEEQRPGLFRKTPGLEFTVDADRLSAVPYGQLLLFSELRRYGFSPAQIDDIARHREARVGAVFASDRAELLVDRRQLQLRLKCPLQTAPIALPREGEVTFEGGTLELREAAFTSMAQVLRSSGGVTLDADKLTAPLSLRRAARGDRFVPFGMDHGKLVSDFLTNLKLSRFEKEATWVVCCGDAIVWIVNRRPDQRFRVTENTRRVLTIRLKP
jgi:tRNA(Ile)-lysidine synthase